MICSPAKHIITIIIQMAFFFYFKNSKSDVFQIAFFGGSTGYNGDPPIDKLIENILRKNNIKANLHLIFHLYLLITTNIYIAY